MLAPIASAMLASVALAGCGGGSKAGAPVTTTATPVPATTTSAAATTSGAASSGSMTAPASTNPCSLLTDAEVARLATGVGHGKLDTVAGGNHICDWPDANGIPSVQLQVYPATSSSLRAELKNGIDAFGGYTIVAVAGLGDEAAAAFQKADASKGLTAGLAALTVRSDDRVLWLSTPRVQVLQGSPAFALVKRLAAKALTRLQAGR